MSHDAERTLLTNEPAAASAAPPAPLSLVVPRSRATSLPLLAAAFGCFGFALGELTGFSVAEGISTALLSAVVSFASGALLSYAGFRRASGGIEADPSRLAAAIAGMSLGLCVGLPAGVYARCNVGMQSFFLGEAVEHSQCLARDAQTVTSTALDMGPSTPTRPSRPLVGLQSGKASSACDAAVRALNLAGADPTADGTSIPKLVSRVIASCELDAP